MAKKIDKQNIQIKNNFDGNRGVKVTLKPKFLSSDIKINNAVVELKVQARVGDAGLKVKAGYGVKETIDFLTAAGENGMVCINITDELQDFMRRGATSMDIEIEGTTSNYFTFFEADKQLVVDYVSGRLLQANNAYRDVSAGTAGGGKINLATGRLTFCHNDLTVTSHAIPVGVSHVFDSALKGNGVDTVELDDGTSISLPSYDCGAGWKLNLNQYLIKDKSVGDVSEDENNRLFTYVDGEGNRHIFEEKYFYEDATGEKVYVKAADISVDLDGKLTYTTGGTTHKIEQEVATDTNLKLVAEQEGFKGIEKIDKTVEEIAELENQIKEIGDYLDNSEVLREFAYDTLKLLDEQGVKRFDGTTPTEDGLQIKLNKKQAGLQSASKESEEFDILLNRRLAILQFVIDVQSREQIIEGWSRTLNSNKETDYPITQNESDAHEYICNCLEQINKLKYGEYDVIPIYKDDTPLNNIINVIKTNNVKDLPELLLDVALEWIHNEDGLVESLEKKESVINFNSSYNVAANNLTNASTQQQREKLEYEIQTMDKEKKKYEDMLEKKEHQLEVLKAQVPVHYVVSDGGTVMGFGVTKNERIFRLLVIWDRYENSVIFNYSTDTEKDGTDKVLSLSDGERDLVKLEYDNKKLVKINDEKGRAVTFEYDSNLLKKIVPADGRASEYFYDASGNLVAVVDADAYGVHFEYSSSAGTAQVTKVTEISGLASVQHGAAGAYQGEEGVEIAGKVYAANDFQRIEYDDFRSTTVTDRYGANLTYVFDVSGRPVTVYKKSAATAGEEPGVEAVSHDYSDGRRAFSVSAIYNAEEMIDISDLPDGETVTYAEEYFGSDAIPMRAEDSANNFALAYHTLAGRRVYPVPYASAEIPDATQKIERMVSAENIAKIIASGATDFVLSGWAKADAAFINRDRETEYSQDEIDNMHIESFDAQKTARRFELRAELTYEKANGEEVTYSHYCSFDWMNKKWQYCTVPVTLSENPDETLASIKVLFDYSFNTNADTAKFMGMSFKEGVWEYAEFDADGLQTYAEESVSDFITEFEYDTDKNLVKRITRHKNTPEDDAENSFVTNYEYNLHGALVRTTDPRGIVTETDYDKNGGAVRSYSYHKDDPSKKFYDESVLGENGKVTGGVNELGDKVVEYEFAPGTDTVSVAKFAGGGRVSYGYDKSGETLLGISSSVDGEETGNVFGRTAGMLTRLSHNCFDIDYAYDGFGRQTSVKIADAEYASAEHDLYSQKTTLATGEVFETCLNEKGDVYAVKYKSNDGASEETLVNNIYDTHGNLTCIKDFSDAEAEEIEEIWLDKHTRPFKVTKTKGEKTSEITAEYDALGNKTKNTVSINGVTEDYLFEYDTLPGSRLTAVTLPSGKKDSIKYDKQGRVHTIQTDGMFSKHFHYAQQGDHASGLVSSLWFGVDNVTKDSLKYSYDTSGNIIAVKKNGKEVLSYQYDALNRLIRENNKELQKTVQYAYDAGGNITEKILHPYTTDEKISTEGEVLAYAYRSDGWRDQLMSYNGQVFTYDALGNPATYKGLALAWQKGRQLASFAGNTYKYNASGIRASKTTTEGVRTEYFTDGSTLLAEANAGYTIRFRYGADGVSGFSLQRTCDTAPVEYFYRKNLQGDITEVYNASGAQVAKYVYDAWGNHRVFDQSGTDVTNAFDYGIIAHVNPLRYRGYYFDAETKLYYLNTRYYDPDLGRFINADDLAYLDPESLNGLNLYAYCNNNPVINIDPEGNAFFTMLIIGILAGAAIGGTVKGVKAHKEGARGWDLVGAVASGVVMGGAMGAVLVIGGAAGLSVAIAPLGMTVAGFGLSTASALGISALIGVGAGFASYSIENGIRSDRQWTMNGFIKAGLSGGFKAVSTFGIGYLGGKMGAFDKMVLNPLLKGTETLSKGLTYEIAKNMLATALPGTGRMLMTTAAWYLGETLAKVLFISSVASGVRWLIDKIFGT